MGMKRNVDTKMEEDQEKCQNFCKGVEKETQNMSLEEQFIQNDIYMESEEKGHTVTAAPWKEKLDNKTR